MSKGGCMKLLNISVTDNTSFESYDEALVCIYNKLYAEGVVKESWLGAMREREESFPTGIELDGYAIAIPHCSSEHANKPAICIMRSQQPVSVNQADGDEELEVNLIISLIVTDPADQLQLLKALFSNMQIEEFYKKLLALPIEEAKALFISTIIQ